MFLPLPVLGSIRAGLREGDIVIVDKKKEPKENDSLSIQGVVISTVRRYR